MTRRAFGRGAAAGLAALLLAGCGGDDEPAAGGGGPQDPPAQLRAAAVKTMTTSFHVSLSLNQVRATGDVDPIGQSLTLDVAGHEKDGSPAHQSVRVIGSDAYQTLGAIHVRGIDPGKYVQFTAPSSAFTAASMIRQADPFDPAALKGLAFAFTGARRTGGGYEGTIDLTKALSSGGLLPPDPTQLKRAGDAVKHVPFEARIENGYLTRIAVRLPAIGSAPAFTAESSFSDFDEHLKVSPPESAQISDVTEELREILTE